MLYTQITIAERNLIDFLYNKQFRSISYIARELKRSKSSISREIKRNSTINGYECDVANQKYVDRQYHKHMMHFKKYEEFTKLFLKYYDKRVHGVEATCAKIKKLHPNVKSPTSRQVFNWIKSNEWDVKKSDRLRRYYKKGGKRTVGIFSKFNHKWVFPIWLRPKYIDKRQEYGHWEVDLIVGSKRKGYDNLITLVERTTREVYIARLKSKSPMQCNNEIYKLIKKNKLLVKSITCDNGIEFDKIGFLGERLKVKIYYCQPYASHQRGSNENTNGLIRRFYKKHTNFSLISDKEILLVQDKINNMPRKMFGWKSSLEVKPKIKRRRVVDQDK